MYYPMYQSYPIPPGQTNIIWVESEEEARVRTRQLFPNSTMIMLDNNKPLAYRCMTDVSGKPQPIEVFTLSPYQPEQASATTPHPAESEEKQESHQVDIAEYMRQQDQRIAELESKMNDRKRGNK